ncbi:hypothetical protein F5883DRAFT_594414, partial [Diaporthe sp. PMI_573]
MGSFLADQPHVHKFILTIGPPYNLSRVACPPRHCHPRCRRRRPRCNHKKRYLTRTICDQASRSFQVYCTLTLLTYAERRCRLCKASSSCIVPDLHVVKQIRDAVPVSVSQRLNRCLLLASEEMKEAVVKCATLATEHGSDHRAIETVFDSSCRPESRLDPEEASIQRRLARQINRSPERS